MCAGDKEFKGTVEVDVKVDAASRTFIPSTANQWWHAAAARTHRSEPEARDPDRPAQAAVPQLHVMLTRTLGDAQHARFVGFCVGFLAPGKRHITARQALGCAFEVQVHNIE